MAMSFRIWFEEHENQRKARKMLLSRLGFTDKVMDDQTIKIRDINRHRLLQAIASMGLPDDMVEQLQNWVKMYSDSTLQELLAQIDDVDIEDEEPADVPSQPAQLPAGQQQPQPQQQMQMPPMQ